MIIVLLDVFNVYFAYLKIVFEQKVRYIFFNDIIHFNYVFFGERVNLSLNKIGLCHASKYMEILWPFLKVPKNGNFKYNGCYDK